MPRSPPSSQTALSSSTSSSGLTGEAPHASVSEPLKISSTLQEEGSDGDEEEDDEKVLETSSDGRWQKINHHVTRDVPGIDDAYLAMDTEEGVEVVWNEVIYSQSSRKANKGSKERLKKILQGLTAVKHQNIVNFYDFWHDKVNSKDRLVFITEYITSGSLAQFLKKNKKVKGTKSISEKIWRRWCRQILSALSYLHKNDIIHGNMSLASIFIQHNGLVKIGSVSPDAIHQHVKTKNREAATTGLNYAAPELAEGPIRTSADIYAFGICALEMLNLDLLGNGVEGIYGMRPDVIQKALDQLKPRTRNFIELCIDSNPEKRPKAHILLKHPVLQEVFTLKLLSAYALRGYSGLQDKLDVSHKAGETVLATVPLKGGVPINYTVAETSQIDVEKIFDEIHQDFLFETELPVDIPGQEKDEPGRTRVVMESNASSIDTTNFEMETRRIASVSCELCPLDEGKNEIYIKLQFGNKMERELRSELQDDERPDDLVNDLVKWGLLANEDSHTVVAKLSPLFKLTPH